MAVANTAAGRAEQLRVIEELRLKVELQEFRGEFTLTDFDARKRALRDYALEVAEGSKSKQAIQIMVKYLALYDKQGVSIGGVDMAFIEGFKRSLDAAIDARTLSQTSAHSYFSILTGGCPPNPQCFGAL